MNVPSLTEDFLLPSPIEELKLKQFPEYRIYIKRDDLIHPAISGNKWRKLQGVIRQYYLESHESIVTFGGAFSNHLLATAVLCNKLKIPCYGYVRTDSIDSNNATLSQCSNAGMILIPMDRISYQNKNRHDILKALKDKYKACLIVPEGGSTSLVKEGMRNLVKEINEQESEINEIICSLGTGGTACGILESLQFEQKLLISPAIKGLIQEDFLKIAKSLSIEIDHKNYEISYHSLDKSYAKKDLELFSFCEDFLVEHDILLDPIYTGKAMRNLLDRIEKKVGHKKKLCFIHTGGIQAWNGYFYRFPILEEKLPCIYRYMKKYNEKLAEQ